MHVNRSLILLVASSAAGLASAVCQIGTCESSSESSISRGTPSLLQRSTARAAPAEDVAGTKIDKRVKLAAAGSASASGAAAAQVSPHMHQPSDLKQVASERLCLTTERDDSPLVSEALVDRCHNLIIGWSPRAACSGAITMFFQNVGMYTDEEQNSWPWIHDYRLSFGTAILPRRGDMKKGLFFKVKIVRDPFARAVSSWVHQTGTNFSNDPHIQELAEKHGLGRNGLIYDCSFLEWLKFVDEVGIDEMDAHTLPQFTEWERNGGKYDMILQLEAPDFDQKLAVINAKTGSTLTFQTMHVSGKEKEEKAWQKEHEASPNMVSLFGANWDHPSPEEMFTTPPYGPEAAELVKKLYAQDFEAYGYSLNEYDI